MHALRQNLSLACRCTIRPNLPPQSAHRFSLFVTARSCNSFRGKGGLGSSMGYRELQSSPQDVLMNFWAGAPPSQLRSEHEQACTEGPDQKLAEQVHFPPPLLLWRCATVLPMPIDSHGVAFIPATQSRDIDLSCRGGHHDGPRMPKHLLSLPGGALWANAQFHAIFRHVWYPLETSNGHVHQSVQ